MEKEKILEMLEERRFKELKTELENLHPVDIAELLEEFEEKQMILIFRLLAKDEAAETFTEMNSDMRETLLNALTDSEIEEVMAEMYLDDTVDVLEEMPANVVERLLLATDEETRAQINELLNYPDDSAGSIMNVEYIAFQKEMTVEEAILKIRQVGINRETIYTCYVTEKRKLIGVVNVKDLLTTGDNHTIEEIMETNMIYVHTHDDQEEAATLINKYGLIAIPVVDNDMRMVGIVTVDDAMEVLEEEATEDMSMMAGIAPSEDSYFETTVWEHAKSRFPWLLFLMLSATLSGLALDHFDYVVAVMPILNSFVPMLTGTGGNCGSQSSTLIIRGLATNEIEFKDIFRVMFKEIRVALTVSVMLAIVNGIRIVIMYNHIYDNALMIAIVLGITLICTVLLSKTIGCTLPLVAKKCGLDPALMAAPLITTLVDTGTILLYFTIATKIFNI
ncbi:MAG: magnesium transporter [Tyzzerella sp.]|nr:magnesium transporter [Tyzzerella sp.]